MYNSCIIGCGRIAGINDIGEGDVLTHAAAYKSSPYFDLKICYDENFDKAKAFGELHNCEVADSINTALERYSPEVISVCTPDDTHFSVCYKLLQNNKRPKIIFVEKPVCTNPEEFRELLSLSKKVKTSIIINHTRKFNHNFHNLKSRVASNEFGTLIQCFVYYYGGLRHNGVHLIDALSFLFNDALEVVKVDSGFETAYPNDPTIELELKFEKVPGRILFFGIEEKYYQLFEMDFHFSNSRLRIEDFGERIIIEKKYVNNSGENVLIKEANTEFAESHSPILNAVNIMAKSLNDSNLQLLNEYNIESSTITMNTIWNAENELKKMSR